MKIGQRSDGSQTAESTADLPTDGKGWLSETRNVGSASAEAYTLSLCPMLEFGVEQSFQARCANMSHRIQSSFGQCMCWQVPTALCSRRNLSQARAGNGSDENDGFPSLSETVCVGFQSTPEALTHRHLESALSRARPSASSNFLSQYEVTAEMWGAMIDLLAELAGPRVSRSGHLSVCVT
jgi:hypothetical protein